jgi:hypothetical protein
MESVSAFLICVSDANRNPTDLADEVTVFLSTGLAGLARLRRKFRK